jgi:hypothetical protein
MRSVLDALDQPRTGHSVAWELEIAMIQQALGATDLDVEGLNAREAFEIEGGVTAFIAWKLGLTSYFEGQRVQGQDCPSA